MKRIIRYLFSGGTAAVVNLGTLFVLTHYAGLHYLISGVLGFGAAVIVSFFMQKKWTFEDHSTENTHKKFGVYLTVTIINNLVISTALLYFFTDIVGLHYMVSQFIASGLVAILSYFIYKMVFKADVRYHNLHEAAHNDPETR